MNQESTGSATYNKEFCQRAAQAFGELLSLVDGGETQFGLIPFEEYSSNFMTIGLNERMPGQTTDLKITEAIFRPSSFGQGHNGTEWGQAKAYGGYDLTETGVTFLPTANYVNYYGMADGTSANGSNWNFAKLWGTKRGGLVEHDNVIHQPTANYINYAYGMADGTPAYILKNGKMVPNTSAEGGSFDPTHPWQNRDPRFYHDIIFDGCKVVEGTLDANKEWLRYANLQTRKDPNDKQSLRDITNGSRTGYLNYKFINVRCNNYDKDWDYSLGMHMCVPYMRLADIYLMYAEAAAEAQGTAIAKINCGLTALDAINKVRARAGVEPVAAKYTNSLEDFMSEVRRERAVELSFEGHRFNDLRRWLLLDKYPYNIKTSQEFNRVGEINKDDPSQNQVSEFREEIILTRNFTSKHYWLPLKKVDTSMYLEFKQNPGW